LLYTIFHL